VTAVADLVFLSYSRRDSEDVRLLREELEAAGFEVWMDEQRVRGGRRWRERIVDALCETACVLVCVSPAWRKRDAFVHKEVSLALKVEQEFYTGRSLIIPARLRNCQVPAVVGDRHCVDLYKLNGFNRLVEAIREAAERTHQTRRSVEVTEKRERLLTFLAYLENLDEARFLPWCEISCTILVTLLILEVGLMQEWGPPSQHPQGFPGWASPQSVIAIVCSALAALVYAGGNLLFYSRCGQSAEWISRRSERLYMVAIGFLIVISVVVYALLMVTTHEIPAIGDRLPRSGQFQVFKTLFVLGLEFFVLLWPSWFYAVWVTQGMTYRRPALIVGSPNQIVFVVLIAVLGMGMLQWYALKNPHDVGAGDAWRTTHIVVQGMLMILLAWNAWWCLSVAKRLQQEGTELLAVLQRSATPAPDR
jgi:hypothetical protein